MPILSHLLLETRKDNLLHVSATDRDSSGSSPPPSRRLTARGRLPLVATGADLRRRPPW